MNKKISFRSKIFFLLVFGFLSILGSVFFYSKVIANKDHKISGWAWSENIGWTSLNCYNSGILSPCSTTDYGVDHDKNTGELSGYAWSENAGWLCFGLACKTAGELMTPEGSAPWANIDAEGLISGWARWVNLGSNGWVKLQGGSKIIPGKKYACRNCASLKDSAGETCGLCFVNPFNEGSSEICKSCKNCADGICGSCDICYSYGTGIDFSNNTMVGWAWNKGNNDTGFGWLKFHPTQTKTLVDAPYVNTVGGDVYAQKGLGSMFQSVTPEGKFNATYLLQSNGDIVHFNSQCGGEDCSAGWVTEDAASMEIPKKENNYQSGFGNLDLRGLLSGQYGAIEFINSDLDIDSTLGGKVYYYTGDLILNNRNILNGFGEVSGGGTIVVKGDVFIKGGLAYQSGTVSKNKNMASLGIIVLSRVDGTGGNIYIDPSVLKLAGNFLAEGIIYTGTNKGDDQSLDVQGLFIAKGFQFERNNFNLETKEPSEKIVYDGRVLLNPPPGFSDIGKSLPKY